MPGLFAELVDKPQLEWHTTFLLNKMFLDFAFDSSKTGK
jgi:hypothetical protein